MNKSPETDPHYEDPSVTHPDQFVRVQLSATRSRVFHMFNDEYCVRRLQLRPIVEEEPDPDMRRVIEEEGARPSSLIPVHKPRTSDPLHDLQLLRDVKIINERTAKELGPLPLGGLPVQTKRKPKTWNPDASASTNLRNENEEDEAMKPRYAIAATTLAIAGLLTACDAGSSSSTTNNEKMPEASRTVHEKSAATQSQVTIQRAASSAVEGAIHVENDIATPATASSLVQKNEREVQQTTAAGARSEDAARSAIESREPLTAPGVPNGLLKTGMDYADLRRAVLAQGWVPVVNVQCKTNVDGGDKVCDQMPELSECSTDGYCLMHFHLARTNQNMEVGTYGDLTGWDVQAKDSQLAVTGLTVTPASTH